MIGLGFCTYGFHLMRSLGNNLTCVILAPTATRADKCTPHLFSSPLPPPPPNARYHSPSRGYCMEMGASIVVIIASRIGLPISTTQCITGATMAVGLLNGARGVNWKRFFNIFLSWLFTMPITGIFAGLLFEFLASNPTFNAPKAS